MFRLFEETQVRFIAIDPGLHSAGYAIFEGKQPVRAGLIRPDGVVKDYDLLVRANNVGKKFAHLAQDERAKAAYIEFPVSYGATDSRAGSIQKLCAGIGAIAGHLHSVCPVIQSILVPDWKGQLSKRIVIKRIQKILTPYICEQLKLEEDAWDAVGIGLYKVGRFN